MKNDTILKINKLSKVGYILSSIGKVALMIAAIACLVGSILMCFVPKEAASIQLSVASSAVIQVDESISFTNLASLDSEGGILELGQNRYQIVTNDKENPDALETTFYLSDVKWILFGGVFTCVAACVSFFFAGKLCAWFKECDTPFSEEISTGLVKLVWSLIPLCMVTSVMESAVDSLGTGRWDLVIGVDLTTVLLILCVFLLSYIFKYGTVLQIESDETL